MKLFSIFFLALSAFIFIVFLSNNVYAVPTVCLAQNVDKTINSSDFWDNLNTPANIVLADLGGISDSLSPSNGHVLTYNSTSGQWESQAGGGTGTVTSISRGFGLNLTGTAITTTGTLDINTTRIQARVSSTCSSGNAIRVIAEDGTVTCQSTSGTDTNETIRFQNLTEYNCGAGLVVDGIFANGTVECVADADTITTDTNETIRIQNLTSYTCSSGTLVNGVFANGTVKCATDSGGSDTNETIRLQNITSYDCASGFAVKGHENNGTAACVALPTDTDTNETIRFQNLTSYDCGSGNVVQGVFDNGTVACIADANSGASNIFDQNLSTTAPSPVRFNNLTIINGGNFTLYDKMYFRLEALIDNLVSGLLKFTVADAQFSNNLTIVNNLTVGDKIRGDGRFITAISTFNQSDFNQFQNLTSYTCGAGLVVDGVFDNGTIECVADAGATDTNETIRFQNLTSYDCPAGNLVIGVQNNGTVLCAADANTPLSNPFDQVLNITSNVKFANVTSTGNVTIARNLTFSDTGSGWQLNSTSYGYWNASGCWILTVGQTKEWTCP